MNRIRTYLLATIGIISGIWMVLETFRHKYTRPTHFSIVEKSQFPSDRSSSSISNPSLHPNGQSAKDMSQYKPKSQVSATWGYLKTLYTRFNEDYCGQWAAALSFFALLSIAPILLCALAVLGFLIHDANEAAQRIQHLIANLLPGAGAQKAAQQLILEMHIQETADALIKGKVLSLIIGGLSLLWGALQIFANAMTPMNAAFRVKETRGFIKQRVVALIMLIVVGLLFLISLLPSTAAHFVFALPGFQEMPEVVQRLVGFLFSLLGIGVNAVMFTITYRFLPSPAAKVSWKEAAAAGGVVALLWEIAKQGFALYLANFPKYSAIYGALGGLFVLVIWIYYSSMILLLGAEIAHLYGEHHAKKRGEESL